MESTVYFKNVHITPKKLRFLLNDVKRMKPVQALDHLFYSPKKGAQLLYKAIKSAVDNAKYTLKTSEDLLQFKLLCVEQGNQMKRYRPGGRGTAKQYVKKRSHIKIVLLSSKVEAAKPIPQKPSPAVKEKSLPVLPNAKNVVKKRSVRKPKTVKK